MKLYSLGQTAEMLSLSKDTLRYYDKIHLVRAQRGENKYRFYTDSDLLILQYVEVMKFAGLSLSEIGEVLRNRMEQMEDNRQSTLHILRRKSEEIQRKIWLYQELNKMMLGVIQTIETKTCPADKKQVDEMVQKLYRSMEECECHEE